MVDVVRRSLLVATALLLVAMPSSALPALGVPPTPVTPPDQLPFGLTDAPAVWAKGAIYTFGGDTTLPGGPTQLTPTIIRYVPGTTAVPIGTLPGSLAKSAAVFDGSTIYIFGGHTGSQFSTQILSYIPGTPAATSLTASLPTPTQRMAGAYVGGAIYLFGGDTPDGKSTGVLKFDVATKALTSVTSLPEGIGGSNAVVHEGLVYISGGETRAGRSDRVYRFDPATSHVQVMPYRLPTSVQANAAVSDSRDGILLFGGLTSSGVDGALRRVEPCAAHVSTLATTGVARSALAAVADGAGNAYVLGGRDANGAKPVAIVKVTVAPLAATRPCAGIAYDELPTLRPGMASAVLGGKAYFLGGWEAEPGASQREILEYDGSHFRVVGLLPHGIAYAGSATDGTSIYLLGGKDGATTLGGVSKWTPGTGWTDLGTSRARLESAVVYADGLLYSFGGYDPAGDLDTDITTFDLTSGVTAAIGSVPTFVASAALDGGVAYVVAQGTVYSYPLGASGLGPAIVRVFPYATWTHADLIRTSTARFVTTYGDDLYEIRACDAEASPVRTMMSWHDHGSIVSMAAGQALVVGGDWSGAPETFAVPSDPCVPTPLRLPAANERSTAVWIADHGYVFGGAVESPSGNAVVGFDGSTQIASRAASLPSVMGASSSVTDGTNAFIFGGHTGSDYLSSVVRYTPGETPTVVGYLPQAADLTAAGRVGSKAYVMGGHFSSRGYKDSIVQVDLATGEATMVAARLPAGRAAMAAASMGTGIYMFGGVGTSGYTNQILKYDTLADAVTVVGTLPYSVETAGAVLDGQGGILVLGGSIAGTPTNRVVRFNPCDGTVTEVAPFGGPGRSLVAAATNGEGVVYLFGGHASTGRLDSIVAYTIPSVPYCAPPPPPAPVLPVPVQQAGAVWLGGSAYVVGGDLYAYNGAPTSAIVQYTPDTGVVRTVANLPEAASGPMVVANEGSLYAMGGLSSSSTISTQVVRYTPGSTPVRIGELPSKRYAAAATNIASHAYVLGGWTGSSHLAQIVDVDLATGTSTVVPSVLPSARSDTSAATDGAIVYLFGGWDGSQRLDDIVAFDPATGSVTTLDLQLPAGVRWSNAVFDGVQSIYVIGGEQAGSLGATRVVRFTPCDGTVTDMTPVDDHGRIKTATAFDGVGTAYVFGGRATDSTLSRAITPYAITPETRCVPPPPPEPDARLATPVADAAALGTSGGALLFGGAGSSGPTADIVAFDAATEVSSVVGALPSARSDASVAQRGGTAYVFGGATSSGFLDEVVAYDTASATATVMDRAILPTPRAGLSAVDNGTASFVFGGRDADGYVADILRLSGPKLHAEHVALPTARADMGAALVGQTAYLVGGRDASGPLADIVAFDLAAKTVTTLAVALPTPVYDAAVSATPDGLVCIVGGQGADGPVDTILVFDPVAGTLTSAGATIPPSRSGAAAVWDGAHVDVLGGRAADGALLDHVLELGCGVPAPPL